MFLHCSSGQKLKVTFVASSGNVLFANVALLLSFGGIVVALFH